ncbi:Protein-L-isoaspartate O-methyltransferase [Candidatus Entotheonellaceae bacterium PAL068K]
MSSNHGSDRETDDTRQRRAMVKVQLQGRDIRDPRVLQAMGEVPRHLFVAPEWRQQAYSDRPLPISEGQTISQPYMVACMVQSLQLPNHATVLEIGAGSGYQAAVLSRIASQVYTIEYFASLAKAAASVLRQLGYLNVQVRAGDGGYGLPDYAPYAGIIVAAAAPHVPSALLEQLAEGGHLVIPVGVTDRQELLTVTRHGGSYSEKRSLPCRFVPLLGQQGWGNRMH